MYIEENPGNRFCAERHNATPIKELSPLISGAYVLFSVCRREDSFPGLEE